jgi:hypothetical protein
MELGHAFSECFSQSLYRWLYTHHPSSEIGTIGEIVAEVRTGFSLKRVKKILIVTICEYPIITNPNPVYSHSYY